MAKQGPLPLSKAAPDLMLSVSQLDTGHNGTLHDLGIYAGSRVAVVAQFPMSGPLLVQVGQSLVALERDIASRIMVAPP